MLLRAYLLDCADGRDKNTKQKLNRNFQMNPKPFPYHVAFAPATLSLVSSLTATSEG